MDFEKIAERLGLDTDYSYKYKKIPVAQIELEGAVDEVERDGMATTIKAVGVLQPPSIVEVGKDQYKVIMGRRRIEAAKAAGLDKLECRVYPKPINPIQVNLMRLVENRVRTPNWGQEVAAVKLLLGDKVALTHKELAELLGKKVTEIHPLLKLAELPDGLVQAMCDGRLSQKVAKLIVRLPPDERERFAVAAERGETVTEKDVRGEMEASTAAAIPMFEEEAPDPMEPYFQALAGIKQIYAGREDIAALVEALTEALQKKEVEA